MKLITLMFLSGLVYGQTTIIMPQPKAVPVGSTSVALDLSFQGTGTDSGVSAIQWEFTLPTGFTITNVETGPAALTVNKNTTCTVSKLFCLIYGGQLNMPDQKLVTVTLAIPPGTPPGLIPIAAPQALAATSAGAAIPIVTASSGIQIVAIAQDLNGDGKIDDVDVKMMADEVIATKGGSACVHDQNGDGKCDVYDVQLVAVRAAQFQATGK